jgi:hypothetical protein
LVASNLCAEQENFETDLLEYYIYLDKSFFNRLFCDFGSGVCFVVVPWVAKEVPIIFGVNAKDDYHLNTIIV